MKKKRFHMTGIKGAGMSALAQVIKDSRLQVEGTDVPKEFFTQNKLVEKGIPFHHFGDVRPHSDSLVVASRAFPETHEDIQWAKSNGMEWMYYHQFLGEWVDRYQTSIAVSGSHGKTSTTGMMAYAFEQSRDTAYLIGDGTGKGTESFDVFAFEACEYKNHFLSYYPDYAVITNIDFDHPDFFEDEAHVQNTFERFASQVKKQVIGCAEDKNVLKLALECPVWLYGRNRETAHMVAEEVVITEEGTSFYVRMFDGEEWVEGGQIFLPLFGDHHIMNALSVLSVLYLEGEDWDGFTMFRNYQGVQRRFAEETLEDGRVIVDDYGHHPTEIKATLQTVRQKYPNERVGVIFQPHTFSRTGALKEQFARALEGFDEVVLAPVFGSAREKEQSGGSEVIAQYMDHPHTTVMESEADVQGMKDMGVDVVVFQGAGDVMKFRRVLEAEVVV